MTVAQPIFYRDLLPSERRLVAVMHRLRFGRFSKLPIRGGEAILSPWPTTVCGVKFGDKIEDQLHTYSMDAKLPQQTCELLTYIRATRDGEILTLEFRHGLPFRMEIEAAGSIDDSIIASHEEGFNGLRGHR